MRQSKEEVEKLKTIQCAKEKHGDISTPNQVGFELNLKVIFRILDYLLSFAKVVNQNSAV
jgi:hypothetical protein